MNKVPLCILSGLSLAPVLFSAEVQKPNVIFIMLDDFGYHQMGCYGSTYFETPNMDRLAQEGMRFTNAYASAALSSPTRAALLSGKYPARLKLTDWLNGYAEPTSVDLSAPNWTKGLAEEELVLPAMMKSAGYATSLIGKWHVSKFLGAFDEVLRNDGPKNSDECESDCHHIQEYTTAAIDFITRHKDKPFFLYLAHNAIHTPESEENDLIAKYRVKTGSVEKGMWNPVQGAMVERLDRETGRLFDEITKLGLDENTIIILFSDNGQYSPQQKIGPSPLRGAKVTYWEGGFREPLIVRWKNKITSGSVCDAQVIAHDFLPTIAEMCGITTLNTSSIDGKSFAGNLLTDPSKVIDRPYLCWHYPHYHPEAQFMGAIRKGDWKLIENFDKSIYFKSGAFELYNLKNDPKETTNLAETEVIKAVELYKDLQNWRTEMQAQMPLCKKEVVGKAHFLFHKPNISIKFDLFEQQSNIQEGLRFDGEGTFLSVLPNATMDYWIDIDESGIYSLKILVYNETQTVAPMTLSIAGKNTNLSINPEKGWQEVSVAIPYIEKGIYKATITNGNVKVKADKFVLTNQQISLVHDGNAEEANVYSEGPITFEDGEQTTYTSIVGNSAHQLQVPLIVTNPDINDINPTKKCLYVRSNQNVAGNIPGWFANNVLITLKETLEISNKNKYMHMIHWKGRVLNSWVIYGSEDGTNYEELGRGACPEAGKWFDMVVDVSSKLQRIKYIRIHLDGNWSGSGEARYYTPTDFYYDELVFSNLFSPRTEITSHITSLTTENKIKIFPNPIVSQLKLKSEIPLTDTRLYNCFGQKVFSQQIDNLFETNINMEFLPSGIYLLEITDSQNKHMTEKIIKH